MKYFAYSFGFRALQYFWLLVWLYIDSLNHLAGASANFSIFFRLLVLQLISIVSGLCIVAAARDIENKKPLLPRACRFLLAASLVTTFLGYTLQAEPINRLLPYQYQDYQIFYELLARSFPSAFSAYCLFLIGRAIFSNISVRLHPQIAWSAISIASIYAGVQILYGLSPLVAQYFVKGATLIQKFAIFDSVLIGIALPLNILLCGVAYLLVMRFFEILNEVRRLQEDGTERRQDYLSSDGVVRLIGEKLSTVWLADEFDKSTTARGFVNLVIRLPGEQNKRVACILWPNDGNDKSMVILDWLEATKFSPVSINYNLENTIGDLQWGKSLNYIGYVLTGEESKELIWPKDFRGLQTGSGSDRNEMKAIVNVAIEAHGAAIGCLQVAHSKYNFSQLAIRQIREIAHLISPSVQAYRELAGLDQMSIRFAERQAEETIYSPEAATRIIAGVLHDIFSPTVTRLHVNFGFSTGRPVYMFENKKEHIVYKMEEEFRDKPWVDYPLIISGFSIKTQKLLKKTLTARVTETLSTSSALTSVIDRLVLGNLTFAVNEDGDDYNHPTLGTSYLHRKTASTLAADAYLAFVRDYHNNILKELGKDLSQQRLNLDEWFELINKVFKKAGLSWVVAEQKGKTLGDEQGAYLIQNLTQSTTKKEEKIVTIGEVEIGHYELESGQSTSSHVLKINLQSSEGAVWLGVERSGFGPELEFSSPWRNFLVNFAQIADAALSRITFPEKFQLQLEAAQLQGIISAVITTRTVTHQLSNMIQGQSNSSATLLDALKLGKLKVEDESLERIIFAMNASAERMQDMFKSFNYLAKIDEHSPCQLIEAAEHAFKLFELSLLQRRIDMEINVDASLFVDVPFNVAALALANLVGNAKDAVDKGGRILIKAEQSEDFALCRVIDNGRGIVPELRDKIFNPNVTTKETGTGLGLYLTYQSLKENRASVELTKTDETGSVFTVRFPLFRNEVAT